MKKYFAPEYSKEEIVSDDIILASYENGIRESVETVYGENGEELGTKTTFNFSLKNFFNFLNF